MPSIDELPMRPESRSQKLLAITRSKAKMYEYGVSQRDHIQVVKHPENLLRLTIGLVGDLAGSVARGGRGRPMAKRTKSVRFAARFFDAYVGSKLTSQGTEPHLLLLAAAAYYLSNLPGSASVVLSSVQTSDLATGAEGLDRLLAWLLRGDLMLDMAPSGQHDEDIQHAINDLRRFYGLSGDGSEALAATQRIRVRAYDSASSRQILFADVCVAVLKQRIEWSARTSMPKYSGLPLEAWEPAMRRASFVRELWPAQHRLGEIGVFAGVSTVVQMPTSAGKSRATELIIRSAFLGDRTRLAVVVTPFRALCHEVRDSLVTAFYEEGVDVNALSDVYQRDFDLSDLVDKRSVLVVTPEKLVYVLRQSPEIAAQVGLLILDEGHQFGPGMRGVIYELLVTSLNEMVAPNAQKVLISAVIANASEMAQWMSGEYGKVASGHDLLPTDRSVAFASWTNTVGRLEFVSREDPDTGEFFVPRLIRSKRLMRMPRERKERHFPTKNDGRSVALYLGLRLVENGAVAVFCGRKDTATGICTALADLERRGLDMTMPSAFSDPEEVARLATAYETNLGTNAAATQAARLGVVTHHGNTPHGVRLAVENAVQRGLAKFVVCTSTLGQGVNLPIRYLLVTTDRQGGERIKVRDFHNLMGRAGRSGMHTEGSVIFTNPSVYDKRSRDHASWNNIKALLRPEAVEPCTSGLMAILEPLTSDGGRLLLPIDPMEIVHEYLVDVDGEGTWIDTMADELARRWFSAAGLRRQLASRSATLSAIESFLLAQTAAEDAGDEIVATATSLAQKTFAYHQAATGQRVQLTALFEALATNVRERIPNPDRRRTFGRTLFGVAGVLSLEKWVSTNYLEIVSCDEDEALLRVIWPQINERIRNDTFNGWRPEGLRVSAAIDWIKGASFGEMHQRFEREGVRIGGKQRPRKLTIEHPVEVGENAIGFEGSHILGAIAEVLELLATEEGAGVTAATQRLQKRMKYGLPSVPSILLFEAGFADRPIAMELAELMPGITNRYQLTESLKESAPEAATTLKRYPSYFQHVLGRIIRS